MCERERERECVCVCVSRALVAAKQRNILMGNSCGMLDLLKCGTFYY